MNYSILAYLKLSYHKQLFILLFENGNIMGKPVSNGKNVVRDGLLFKLKQRETFLIVTFQRSYKSLIYNHFLFMLIIFASASLLYYLRYQNVFIGIYIAIATIVILYKFISSPKEETITVVKTLGFQITTKYFVGKQNLFIPWSQVQQAFINEVIIGDKVLPFLTLLIKVSKDSKQEEKLVPLFENMQPHLRQLEIILKHIQGLKS